MMFLTDKELYELTGFKRRKEQRQWLADNNFKFEVRRDGKPQVLPEQIRERQGIKSKSKPGPDFSWLDETGTGGLKYGNG